MMEGLETKIRNNWRNSGNLLIVKHSTSKHLGENWTEATWISTRMTLINGSVRKLNRLLWKIARL